MPSSEIAAGRIAGIFGIRGELKCDPTPAGRILFVAGATFRCERDDGSSTIELLSARPHKERLLLRIEGVDTAEAAQLYAGAKLFAPRADVTLNQGEYLDEDLIGCAVVAIDGRTYGEVERVEHYPSSDMLVVAGRMVPMVRAIIANIDMENRRITIDPPAGLLE